MRWRHFLEFDNAQKGAPFARKARDQRPRRPRRSDAFAELHRRPAPTRSASAQRHLDRVRPRALARAHDSPRRPHRRHRQPTTTPTSSRGRWLSRFGAQVERIPVDARGELDEAAYAARAGPRAGARRAAVGLERAPATCSTSRDSRPRPKDAGALVMSTARRPRRICGSKFRPRPTRCSSRATSSTRRTSRPGTRTPEFARRFFTADEPTISRAPRPMVDGDGHPELRRTGGLARHASGTCVTPVRRRARRRWTASRPTSAISRRYVLREFAERADRITLYGRGTRRRPPAGVRVQRRGESPESVAPHLERRDRSQRRRLRTRRA